LTVTPALMQAYIRAADKIARLAVGDPDAAAAMTKYNVPKVVNQMRHLEGTPFGTRGGTSNVHNFPADGDYTFAVELHYYYTGELIGSNLPESLQGQEIEISVDGERIAVFEIDPLQEESSAVMQSPPVAIKAGPRRVAAARATSRRRDDGWGRRGRRGSGRGRRSWRRCSRPRLRVGSLAKHPAVSLQVECSIAPLAVILEAGLSDDGRAVCAGGRIVGVEVVDGTVDLARDLGERGGAEQAKSRKLRGQHQHAGVVAEFRVTDAAVGRRHPELLHEAEGPTEKIDRSRGIPIDQHWRNTCRITGLGHFEPPVYALDALV